MKKFLTVATSLVFVCIFCVMAFAQSATARGVVCPVCDHASTITVKIGEEGPHTELKKCSHGKQGYDEYEFHYNIYQVNCTDSSCTYAEAPYSKKSASTYIACHGIEY